MDDPAQKIIDSPVVTPSNGPAPSQNVSTTPTARAQTIAVFDFDGTLTRYDSFVRFLILVLLKYPARVFSCWVLPLDVLGHKLGWRGRAWLKQRFMRRILRGLGTEELEPVVVWLRDQLLQNGFRPEALTEFRTRTAAGQRTLLLSAGLDVYLEPIAAHLGFTDCICSVAQRDAKGVLTGWLDGQNCMEAEKVQRLNALIGVDRSTWHVVAYGDSAEDLALLQAADEAYMVNATGRLAYQCAVINARVVRW
jgi:phosphatidylglycerophosphatase C